MLPNYQRITNFLENKPGYGISIRRWGNFPGASEWVVSVEEPDEPMLQYHVHVDIDTTLDMAIDFAERYISERFHRKE